MAVPWEDGDQRAQALNEQAQQAMAEGRFAEGASLSRRAYDVQPTAAAAARAIHCMRKQGVREARAAVVFGRQPVEQWPAHQWLIREYVWAVYEGYRRSGADHPEEEGTTMDEEFPGSSPMGAPTRPLRPPPGDVRVGEGACRPQRERTLRSPLSRSRSREGPAGG
jgi:hypothetical protein